jgi:hypothetical protein
VKDTADYNLHPSSSRALGQAPPSRKRFRKDILEVVENPPDIAQGTNPGSSFNCWGYIFFPIPELKQSPAQVKLYLRATHWFYYSGGVAILSLVDSEGTRLTEPLIIDNWERGEGKYINLPEAWLPHFIGAAGIGIGLPEGLRHDHSLTWGRFDPQTALLAIWEDN